MKKHASKTIKATALAKNRFGISSFVSSLNSVTKADADDALGSVLPQVVSSHSPLFIFSKENEFLGLVSPYQALYSRRYPHTTKVSSIASMPPYILKESQLFDVASFMLESRIYALPLFDENKKIVGVIHAEDLFKNLTNDPDLLTHMSASIKSRSPVTANNSVSVGEVFKIMKDKQVSRVILVDDRGNLSGIVSRKDLLNVFMKPTQKQRFGKNGIAQTNRAFDKEKEYRTDDPIKNYATERVFTLPHQTEQEEIIKQLLDSKHNSVVIINNSKKPVGFLSMHDVLAGLASSRPQESINLILTKPSSNVSEDDIQEVEEIMTAFGQKLNKKISIDKIEVTVEEPKTPTGGSILFNTTVIISPVAGAKMISKTNSRSYVEGIYSAIDQIKKQERRSGISKVDSQYANL
jgi:predicted transcriptional regulator